MCVLYRGGEGPHPCSFFTWERDLFFICITVVCVCLCVVNWRVLTKRYHSKNKQKGKTSGAAATWSLLASLLFLPSSFSYFLLKVFHSCVQQQQKTKSGLAASPELLLCCCTTPWMCLLFTFFSISSLGRLSTLHSPDANHSCKKRRNKQKEVEGMEKTARKK